jgi:hypothetical protein
MKVMRAGAIVARGREGDGALDRRTLEREVHDPHALRHDRDQQRAEGTLWGRRDLDVQVGGDRAPHQRGVEVAGAFDLDRQVERDRGRDRGRFDAGRRHGLRGGVVRSHGEGEGGGEEEAR